MYCSIFITVHTVSQKLARNRHNRLKLSDVKQEEARSIIKPYQISRYAYIYVTFYYLRIDIHT
jgi:hypothetical protein